MFIRWKKSKNKISATLIKSVRIDGKPRQEVIAHLCRMSKMTAQEALIAWAHTEMSLEETNLTGDEKEQVRQLLEKTISRPPVEMVEKEKQEITAMMASFSHEPMVVSPTPPSRGTATLQCDDPSHVLHKIEWKHEVVYQYRKRDIKYTAFLHRAENKPMKLGSILLSSIEKLVPWAFSSFWYSVHRSLCLVCVDNKTYHDTMQTLENWIQPLPPDEFIKAMLQRQEQETWSVNNDIKAVYRRLDALYQKEKDAQHILTQGRKHLALMQRSV